MTPRVTRDNRGAPLRRQKNLREEPRDVEWLKKSISSKNFASRCSERPAVAALIVTRDERVWEYIFRGMSTVTVTLMTLAVEGKTTYA